MGVSGDVCAPDSAADGFMASAGQWLAKQCPRDLDFGGGPCCRKEGGRSPEALLCPGRGLLSGTQKRLGVGGGGTGEPWMAKRLIVWGEDIRSDSIH